MKQFVWISILIGAGILACSISVMFENHSRKSPIISASERAMAAAEDCQTVIKETQAIAMKSQALASMAVVQRDRAMLQREGLLAILMDTNAVRRIWSLNDVERLRWLNDYFRTNGWE